MASVIFSGDRLKALKQALKLGEGTTLASGNVDPTSVAPGISLSPGSIFMSTLTGGVYIKHTTTANDTNYRQIPNLTASLGSGRVVFTDATGNLTSESELTYDSVANKLAAEQITTTSIQRATNGTLDIGTDSTAQIINIGNSGSTVNVQGTTAFQNVTNYSVTDKAITINAGGSAGSATSAGLEVEEAASITGYARTNPTRDGWIFKAPANGGEFEFLPPTAAHNIVMDFEAQAGSRTYTFPTGTSTLASLGLNETFTGNKTFSGTVNLSSLAPSTLLKLDGSNNITAALLTNADVDSAAAIAYGKLNLSGSIVNSDIAALAAIDRSKLAAATANTFATNNGTGQLSATAVTANRAVATDLNGLPVASVTTDTELGYLSGVTSSVQTQINTVSTDLANHISDAIDAHDASAISNVPSGNLAATDVQSALNELQSDVDTRATQTALDNHINDTTDAHDASAISNVPSGNLVATDVQAALNELQTDIDDRATTSLNNLGTTSINANLIPAATNTYSLGDPTTGTRWANVLSTTFLIPGTGVSGRFGTSDRTGAFAGQTSNAATFRSGNTDGANSGELVVRSGEVVTSGNSGDATFRSGENTGSGNSGALFVRSGNTTSGNSGGLTIKSGDSSSGGATGNVDISTGTTTGLQGAILQTARFTRLPNQSSDPASPLTGAVYYNTTSNILRYYNGTTWADIGSVETDWASTTFDTTTLGGFGTVSSPTMFYKRVGDSVFVRGSFTAGTVSAAVGILPLPAGLSIDTAKMGTGRFPVGHAANQGVIGDPFVVFFNSGTGNLQWGIGRAGVGGMLDNVNVNVYYGSGTTVGFQYIVPISGWSSSSSYGSFTAATQAEMEAGVSTIVGVTPARQQYHPSSAKAWVKWESSTVFASYNVSSVTDNGAADQTINFTVPFSSTDYAIAGCSGLNDTSMRVVCQNYNLSGPATGSCRLQIIQSDGLLSAAVRGHAVFYGDQ